MDEPVLDKSAQGGLSKKATKTSILVLDRTTGALEVLLLLYRRDSCSKTAIRRALPFGQEAIRHTMDTLQALELISLEASGKFPFRGTYRLTGLGLKMVESPLLAWPTLLASGRGVPTSFERAHTR